MKVHRMPSTTIVPAGKLINIQCKVNLDNINNKMPMHFETEEIELPEGLGTADTIVFVKSGMNHCLKVPVINNSKHDIFLPKNTIIGRLQQISHITPLQVKERKENISTVQSSLNKDGTEMGEEQEKRDRTAVEIKEHQQKVLDSIDASGLNPEKIPEVQQSITREADVFSFVDSDIGNITSTQMEIKPYPTQLPLHPKPLYAELKTHIENLYNKGWIINSSSSYSSPVVPVRKKDGSLQFYCNYRQLNSKTIPDRHSLPKTQNRLENLGGSQYFSILDQAKSYHQIHLSPESCHLTAFITPLAFYEWVKGPFGVLNAGCISEIHEAKFP